MHVVNKIHDFLEILKRMLQNIEKIAKISLCLTGGRQCANKWLSINSIISFFNMFSVFLVLSYSHSFIFRSDIRSLRDASANVTRV